MSSSFPRHLTLAEGKAVLDIGCGWSSNLDPQPDRQREVRATLIEGLVACQLVGARA